MLPELEQAPARTHLQHEDAAVPMPTDFQFTTRDFEWLRKVASEYSGIVFPETKRNMIYSRLAKRLRSLGMKKFSEYRSRLEGGDEQEFSEFINALTTNLTSFFREAHHFEHLRDVAIPERQAVRNTQKRLRVWSAGCSTGEEPYSISMTVKDALSSSWDYRVLATDLDSKVLATAASGVYPDERVAELERALLRQYFLRGAGTHQGSVRIKNEIKAPISFQQLNLVQDWSFHEPFDVIFCRNVVIYFDKPTQKRLFDKLANSLASGGYLYIGHSETLFHTNTPFELVGKTTYRRI